MSLELGCDRHETESGNNSMQNIAVGENKKNNPTGRQDEMAKAQAQHEERAIGWKDDFTHDEAANGVRSRSKWLGCLYDQVLYFSKSPQPSKGYAAQ
jgi:hypothetical protein